MASIALTDHNETGGAGPSVNDGTLSFGTADPARPMYGIAGWRAGSAVGLSSYAIGGVSATILDTFSAQDGAGAFNHLGFVKAAVPTGTTGNVTVTLAGTVTRCQVALFRTLDDLSLFGTVIKAQGGETSPSAVTLDANTAANGYVLAAAYAAQTGGVAAWNWSGLTEAGEWAQGASEMSVARRHHYAGDAARDTRRL